MCFDFNVVFITRDAQDCSLNVALCIISFNCMLIQSWPTFFLIIIIIIMKYNFNVKIVKCTSALEYCHCMCHSNVCGQNILHTKLRQGLISQFHLCTLFCYIFKLSLSLPFLKNSYFHQFINFCFFLFCVLFFLNKLAEKCYH